MTLVEQIQQQLSTLPPEKQSEVLDFVNFLHQQFPTSKPAKPHTLRKHPAFGLWRGRGINALNYEQNLRAEWDAPV